MAESVIAPVADLGRAAAQTAGPVAEGAGVAQVTNPVIEVAGKNMSIEAMRAKVDAEKATPLADTQFANKVVAYSQSGTPLEGIQEVAGQNGAKKVEAIIEPALTEVSQNGAGNVDATPVAPSSEGRQNGAGAAPQELPLPTNPGEFNEQTSRETIKSDPNRKGWSEEQVNSEVNRQREAHTAKVQEYNQQLQNPEIKKRVLEQKIKDHTITITEKAELNDLRLRENEIKELQQFDERFDGGEALPPDEMKRYQELQNKLKGEAQPAVTGTEKEMLQKESENLIQKIKEGEGDLSENFLQLEDVTRRMRGEAGLTANLRKQFAEALKKSIITGENVNNKEAQTVLQRIAELYGLESQLDQYTEMYQKLEAEADRLDEYIDEHKNVSFDEKKENKEERIKLNDAYVQLTLTEAQMSQLLVIDKELEQRFNETQNFIDFNLGRQNIISYAVRGIGNKGRREVLNASRPSLRSTRHRDILGFSHKPAA